MGRTMALDELPPDLQRFLELNIVAPEVRKKPDVFIPEPKEEPYVAWRPSYHGEEPPF